MQMTGFNTETRCLMNFCGAVADEILNGRMNGHEVGRYEWSFLRRSVMLRYCSDPHFVEYEQDIIVFPKIIWLWKYSDKFEMDDIDSYLVSGCRVRYNNYKNVDWKSKELEPVMTDEYWDRDTLITLAEHRGWGYPNIADLNVLYDKYPDLLQDDFVSDITQHQQKTIEEILQI